MTKDHRLSKDIRYNLLNLPKEIEFAVSENSSKVIRYTYTASGQKLSQQLMEDTGESVRRDYAGPFVYVNDTLAWINTPHGRIINRGFESDIHELVKEFHLRDHLGNTRIVLEQDGYGNYSQTHIADYYPFGMEIQRGAGHTQPPADNKLSNRYLYNGKELQDDFRLNWYDYGARFYDPQLARWHSVDPLAEKYYPISPYAYVANNPIMFIDPDGMRLDWVHDSKNDEYVWMDNVTSAESTPEGYRYVGSNDNDILRDLNLPYSFESLEIGRIGLGLDGESGKGAAITGADAKVSLNLSAKAEISFNPEQGTENNKLGRKFEGVEFTATMSYISRGSSPDLSLDYGGQFYVQTRNTNHRNTMTSSNSNSLSRSGAISQSATISISSNQINRQNPFTRAIVTAGAPNPKLIMNPRPIRNEWNLMRNHLFLQD